MKKRNKKRRASGSTVSSSQNPGPKDRSASRLILILLPLILASVGFAMFAGWSARNANPGAGNSTEAAVPIPTPDYSANNPAKEYVYAGGKLVAVSEPVKPAPDDLAVWRVSSGEWWVLNSDGSYAYQQFGVSSDLPAPGDYDGDGKTDFCVFRPSEGNWYVLETANNNQMAVYSFGANGDQPVPGDYDGDGVTDLALFRASNLTWYVYKIGSGTITSAQYGATGDQPVPGDYDGDGKYDFAMWRNSSASWHVFQSGSGTELVTNWGVSGDKPAQGDYDGDGKFDHAVWRNDNVWYVFLSESSTWMTASFGYQASDIAVQGDKEQRSARQDRKLHRRDKTMVAAVRLRRARPSLRIERVPSRGQPAAQLQTGVRL